MSASWFKDPQQLVRCDKTLEFWPTNQQPAGERINSASRFIIYAACVHYVIKRDRRVFVVAATALAILYVLETSKMIKSSVETYQVQLVGDTSCQLPDTDNPMANVLMGDSGDRPPACFYPTVKNQVDSAVGGDIMYDGGRSKSAGPEQQRNGLQRQFVSSPVTTVVSDQTGFAEWLYGKKNAKMCKSDGVECDPNARGVQLEAFAGLDPSGDKRSGMHGFTHA